MFFQEAVKIDSTWWALVEIPQQNRAENFGSYVLRVCSTIDSVRIPLTSDANSFRESEKDKESRIEKVNGKNTVRNFHDFPITHILREINFEDSRRAKSAILAHLEALNFDFNEFLICLDG